MRAYQNQDIYQADITTHPYKHGDSFAPLYKTWQQMKQNCFNKKSKKYKKYGGRGLTIPRAWLDYIEFKKWANANGYVNGYALHRTEKDKGYYPGNLEWLTRSEAATRNNVQRGQFSKVDLEIIRNSTKGQRELGRIYGVSNVTISRIIHFKSHKKGRTDDIHFKSHKKERTDNGNV